MRTVDVCDAEKQPGKLVDAAEGGEVIVISRDGNPAVKLVPLSASQRTEWSAAVQRFLQDGEYDPDAFEVDRSDLLSLKEADP